MTRFSMGRPDQAAANHRINSETSDNSSEEIQTLVESAQRDGVGPDPGSAAAPPAVGQPGFGNTLDDTLNAIQQQVASITGPMSQASNLDSLFEMVVTQAQALLEADRTLLYQFTTDEKGVVVAESIVSGWTPTLSETLPALCFGLNRGTEYKQRQKVLIEDVNRNGLSPYQRQLFERFQVQSSLALPIVIDQEIRGLFVAQQCSQSRQWPSALVSVLSQVMTELVAQLQTHELRSQLQKQTARERILAKITTQMIEPQDEATIFRFATREVRRFLEADRVVVFRFHPDSGYNVGTIVAEDVLPAYTSALQAQVTDHSFGKHVAKYREGYHWAAADIYGEELPDCHVTILERFQVRANLVTPLLKGEDLWGLLCVNQCDGPRQWRDFEIEFVKRVAAQLSATRQQAEYIDLVERRADRESILAKITTQMIEPQAEGSIFQYATREIRRFLKADRVVVFKFDPDSGYDLGRVVAEDVLPTFSSALQAQIEDHCFGKHSAKYREGYHWAAADIYALELSDCHIVILERFQVRANLVAPLLKGENLWGLLSVHQCDGPRQWRDFEVEFVKRVAAQLSAARQQAEYTELLEQRANRERILTKITTRTLQAEDENSIFNFATREIRLLLNADRVVVFQFDPKSNHERGRVVAEDAVPEFSSALQAQVEDRCFGQHTEKYRQGGYWSASDIYALDLPDCHIAILERFQVRANLVVPLLKGHDLWGLLCVHQCSASRRWQDFEIEFVKQAAAQLSVTREKTEYIQQLTRSVQLEKLLAKVITRIRQTSEIDSIFNATLQAVRSALNIQRVTIYKFRPDYFGDFVAESEAGGFPKLVGSGWEDPYLQEHQGGRFRNNEPLVVDNIYTADLEDCHVEALEHFGVKSCLVVSIFKGQQLWGLLSGFQHSGPRHWEDEEVNLLTQIGSQLGTALQQAEYTQQLAKKAEREQVIAKVATRIRQTLDIEAIFAATAQEVRQVLGIERVTIYKFRPDYFGDFVVESEAGGFPKLVGSGWEDPYLQEHQGGRFLNNEPLMVDNIYTAGLEDCHVEALEQFGVKSCLVVSIFKGQQLWGLLSGFQHSGPRHWEEEEVNLLTQIGAQLGTALQQAEYTQQLAKSAEREQAASKIISKIRQTLDIDTVFNTTTQEIRQLFHCDRVSIYRFNPDWSGEFVAESVTSEWSSLLKVQADNPQLRENISECSAKELERGSIQTLDTYLQRTQGGRYSKGELFRVSEDIYESGFSDCYINILEQFQAKAYIIVAIYKGRELWGLLAAYQNSGPRQWETEEINTLVQIGAQLGVAIQQAESLAVVESRNDELARLAERERNFLRILDKVSQSIIDKIRLSQGIETIFESTLYQLRQLFEADRTLIYRFNPDQSGEFVAESVARGWNRVVGADRLRPHRMVTYLHQNQGGHFSNQEPEAVHDIQLADHDPYYIEFLEQMETRAYIMAPIFAGETLWGLLAVYQNSGPRQWDPLEVNLLAQIGSQLGVALRQSEYLEQLQSQAQQLTEAADREKIAKQTLQTNVLQLLTAVRPALEGNLAVRAPVTEDEVGTVADAYNSTLRVLRKIVTQVQTAANQVGKTSKNSSSAVIELSQRAQQEVQELTQALTQVQAMAKATQAVADSAQQVDQAVHQANQAMTQGDVAMNRTVEGIQAIRTTVSETSKKIKRLSESSQKISKVVNLINDFTDQTQLLALNAAIEATRAGEYGRGFAVVADEIRSLAQRSTEATTDIEKLIEEIQSETMAVATAMDTDIEQVVKGTQLVGETRQSLNAIVSITGQISQLVQDITQSTQAQTQQSQSVTDTMMTVVEIANQSSDKSSHIATFFQELLNTAEDLQATVGKFTVE